MKRIAITLALVGLLSAPNTLLATSDDDMELARMLTLEQVDIMHGLTFESYICKLLESQGYRVENVRGSNDFGVDAIASKRKDRIAIQIKRSKNAIDRRAVSDAGAGKDFYKCNKAMVVTNNQLTESAKQFAQEIKCTVIEREQLIEWITQFRQGSKRQKRKRNVGTKEINNGCTSNAQR